MIYAYGIKNDEMTADGALQIRQFISTLTFGGFILPVFNSITFTLKVAQQFEFLMIALTALIGTTSYLLYYQSIKEIGPVKAMALNTTYSAWTVAISIIFLGTSFSWVLVICCLLALLGVIFTIVNPKDIQIWFR